MGLESFMCVGFGYPRNTSAIRKGYMNFIQRFASAGVPQFAEIARFTKTPSDHFLIACYTQAANYSPKLRKQVDH